MLASVGLSLALTGCATLDRSIALTEQVVTPITIGEASAVSAVTLAEAMLRAGLTEQQILEHGPSVRTSLATSGGAQMRTGKMIVAMFAIYGDQLYVTSQARGTFALPLGEYAGKSF